MRRIPVIATVRDAYTFLAAHLGGIIGLIRLSMVLVTVAQFFTFWRCYSDFMDVAAGGDAARMGPAVLMLLGYLVAKLLLYAVMFVAVVQLALGARTAPTLLHFAFGPAEWRLFRAFCGMAGLLFLASMAVLSLARILLQSAASQPMQAAVGGFMLLVMLAAGLVLASRFLLLAPAIAVGESEPVLRRAWGLSAGHFLSLLGILLLLFLPLALFFFLLDVGLQPQGGVAGGTVQQQMITAIAHVRDLLPLTCGLSFFFSPLVIGLLASASVSSWRALKQEPAALDIAV